MLVLSRKRGESIVVDGEITITVVENCRGRVQLGIDAPAHVTIHREEIHRRIHGALAPVGQSLDSTTAVTAAIGQ
jgi:carbon storage regulator